MKQRIGQARRQVDSRRGVLLFKDAVPGGVAHREGPDESASLREAGSGGVRWHTKAHTELGRRQALTLVGVEHGRMLRRHTTEDFVGEAPMVSPRSPSSLRNDC